MTNSISISSATSRQLQAWSACRTLCSLRRELSRCIFTSQRDDFPDLPQFIEIIGPSLHHLDALRPVFSCVHIRTPNIARFLMRKLTLDGIGIPATHFVQPRGRHSFEAVRGHLFLAVAEPTQRSIHGIFGHRSENAVHGRE